MIERLSKAWALLWLVTIFNKVGTNPIENFILHEKNIVCQFPNFTEHLRNSFWLLNNGLEVRLYCKRCSTFSSSKPVSAHSHCCHLGNTLCLCLHSCYCPSCAWALPQGLGRWFCSWNLWLSSVLMSNWWAADCVLNVNEAKTVWKQIVSTLIYIQLNNMYQKRFVIKVLVHPICPWYLNWAIWEWQSCMQKIG